MLDGEARAEHPDVFEFPFGGSPSVGIKVGYVRANLNSEHEVLHTVTAFFAELQS